MWQDVNANGAKPFELRPAPEVGPRWEAAITSAGTTLGVDNLGSPLWNTQAQDLGLMPGVFVTSAFTPNIDGCDVKLLCFKTDVPNSTRLAKLKLGYFGWPTDQGQELVQRGKRSSSACQTPTRCRCPC